MSALVAGLILAATWLLNPWVWPWVVALLTITAAAQVAHTGDDPEGSIIATLEKRGLL